ncbi:tRNA (adenosine(37)-N6)-threonylcarbamoyltransferase complex ATPase subunit type 1 TsaE [Methyloparacoccus murrellii]
MPGLTRELPDEPATLQLAAEVHARLPPGALVFLHGDLGAGKTTFVRGFLRAAGYAGTVKSPTFTLVEEYVLPTLTLYHFDLYRLGDPEELEWLGIRDYLRPDAIVFVEWPERGAGILPPPDLDIELHYAPPGRRAVLRGSGASLAGPQTAPIFPAS